MSTAKSELLPILITAGVQPSTDSTALATVHYTAADKIRFRFGFPEKIGGWVAVPFSYSAAISGKARLLYSTILANIRVTLIGTNSKLYSLLGSVLTNITPLNTATTAIANSLATDYATLANNPIATVSGSSIITVTDLSVAIRAVGDVVTLSGASTVNGIASGTLNAAHVIHTIGVSSYTFIVASTANATGSGGGASVVSASGVIGVTAVAHGLVTGARVKITGAANTGGISAANINKEFIIRDVSTDFFFIATAGTATSAVTGGGGTGVLYQPEIAAGAQDESIGTGYGMGFFGVGLYGVALQSQTAPFFPRIWFADRFGTKVIATPGNQTGLYSWDASNTAAPVLVSGAPTAINYAFQSDNIVVTLGAGGVPNRIFASDQGDMTQWTASSSNQVFDYTESGAGAFKSHVSLEGVNLLFTDHQTYLFSYLGYTAGVANAIWRLKQLENNIGLIAPFARVAIAGTAYWMDFNNFFEWDGGAIRPMASNTQQQSTILNYVFKNINYGQGAKCFAWYNEQFEEIWFHYPSLGSNECNSVARYNRTEKTWTPDTFDRICAESPNLILGYPRLIDSTGVLYEHETGADANGQPMAWSLSSNLQGADMGRNSMRAMTTKNALLTGFVPDSLQTGNINVEIIGKRFPQSATAMFDNSYTVSPQTEQVAVQGGARLWLYTLSGSALAQTWRGGVWHHYVQESSRQ